MSKKRYTIIARTYDKKNKQLSIGTNWYRKTSPLQKHFACLAGLPEKEYLHAEVQALLRLRDKSCHKIVVERYDSEGNPKLAKPCPVCRLAIEAYGVKELCYTIDQGFVKEKLK